MSILFCHPFFSFLSFRFLLCLFTNRSFPFYAFLLLFEDKKCVVETHSSHDSYTSHSEIPSVKVIRIH